MSKNVLILPGDGIGPEIVAEAVKVLNVANEKFNLGLELVDGRARLLAADELLTGDPYIFVRDAYLQNRNTFVNDGVVQDNFSDFDQEEDWEEF